MTDTEAQGSCLAPVDLGPWYTRYPATRTAHTQGPVRFINQKRPQELLRADFGALKVGAFGVGDFGLVLARPKTHNSETPNLYATELSQLKKTTMV